MPDHKHPHADDVRQIKQIHADDEASRQRVATASNAHVQNIIDSVLKEASPSEAKGVKDALQQMAVDVLKFPNASDDLDASRALLVELSHARQLWEQALSLADGDDVPHLKTQLSKLWGTLHRLDVKGTQYEEPVQHALGFARRAFDLAGA